MKRKSALVFGVIGVLFLTIGVTVFASSGQVKASNRDLIKVITVEEQGAHENRAISGMGNKTVITAEEQNIVENSSALSGFVQQQNGTGFFFEKVK